MADLQLPAWGRCQQAHSVRPLCVPSKAQAFSCPFGLSSGLTWVGPRHAVSPHLCCTPSCAGPALGGRLRDVSPVCLPCVRCWCRAPPSPVWTPGQHSHPGWTFLGLQIPQPYLLGQPTRESHSDLASYSCFLITFFLFCFLQKKYIPSSKNLANREKLGTRKSPTMP